MCHVVEKEGGQTWSMVDSTGLEESVVDSTTPYLLHHLCNHSHKHTQNAGSAQLGQYGCDY